MTVPFSSKRQLRMRLLTVSLFVESYIGKRTSTSITSLTAKEGIETIGSSHSPRFVLFHQLIIPYDAMSLFPKSEVAHISKVSDRSCSPGWVISRIKRAIRGEDMQLKS